MDEYDDSKLITKMDISRDWLPVSVLAYIGSNG